MGTGREHRPQSTVPRLNKKELRPCLQCPQNNNEKVVLIKNVPNFLVMKSFMIRLEPRRMESFQFQEVHLFK